MASMTDAQLAQGIKMRLRYVYALNLGIDGLSRLAEYPLGNVNRRHDAKPLVFALQGPAQDCDCFRQMSLESLLDVVGNLATAARISRLALLKLAAVRLASPRRGVVFVHAGIVTRRLS